jgi:hypothetical protein
MKNSFLLISATILIILFSCRNAETKVDPDNNTAPKKTEENLPVTTGARSIDTSSINNTSADILKRIDNHITCSPGFTLDPNGGITNGIITVKNTLPGITIQKALIEVSILLADNTEYRTDYYTIINIEAGETKVIKIPNTTRGTKVTSHIVKLKSDELTGGEMILVGSRYAPAN